MPNCPECNTLEAYVGFSVVECLNPQCRHYVCAHGGNSQSGHAFVSSSPLPPETQAVVDDFMNNDFPGEVESIQNAVGNRIPVTMDFRNVGGDLKAVRLLISVLRRVRSTLCLKSSQHQNALRSGIQRVAIRHTAPGERKSCTLARGVLDMIVCVDDQKTHTSADGNLAYAESDVDLMVADALDLELGPAVRRLQEWLLDCIAAANDDLRLQIKLDVDWKSFTSHPDNRIKLQVLNRLESEFHQHILYWLRSHAANDKAFRKQLKKVLQSVRVEHVASAAQRELFVDGATIVYRLCVTEDGGAWGYELGDALMAAVMSVQPPPASEDIQKWMDEHGQHMLQRIAQVSDPAARSTLEKFLQSNLPAVALRIQATAGFPVALELDWDSLGRNLSLVPHVIPRVLNRVCGALALVTKNEAHAALLRQGTIKNITLAFTPDSARKECLFEAPKLRLLANIEQPGSGCFDESEMANVLNATLAVEARLAALKEKVPETAERLCESSRSWIDIEIEWTGFLAHADSSKIQRTLMELSEVGLDWVYYALTGQSEDDPAFKEKLRDRVRAIRFVHAPSPKAKNIAAEGSTLIYSLFLHDGYDGRFIIEHLKEIFEEVVETMAPGAPISQKVVDEIDRCERDVLPAILKKIARIFGRDIAVHIDRASIGNDLLAARQLENAALQPLLDALADLARDKDNLKKLKAEIRAITLRHAAAPDGKRCVLKDGELVLESCLDSNSSDAVSSSDISNTMQNVYVECPGSDDSDDEDEEYDEDEDENESDDDEDSDDASEADEETEDVQQADPNYFASYLIQYREQALGTFIKMFNQMNGTSLVLEGDWDAFEAQLKSPSANEVQACLFTSMQLFLSMIMQLSAMNPPFGQAFKRDAKVIRFASARPEETKDITLDGGVLTCRLKPEYGILGGFDQAELFTKLQSVLK